jgi:hypothetical protein
MSNSTLINGPFSPWCKPGRGRRPVGQLVDERQWDAFNTVAARISYPLPPVGGRVPLG